MSSADWKHRRLDTRRDRGLLLLLTAWTASRITMVCLLVVDAEIVVTSDVARYHAVADALVHGQGGGRVEFWEYPLGALGVVVPPILVGGREYLDYLLLFVGTATAFDLATFAGVLLSARRGTINRFGGWIWVTAPLSLGLVSVSRLDVIACASAVLGLSFFLRYRSSTAAGFLLAVGASVKVWPGLLVIPVLAWSRDRTRVVRGLCAAGALLIAATQLFDWWYLSTSFLRYQRDRGIQIESFAALPMLWLDRLNIADYNIEFDFGARQLQGPGTHAVAELSTIAMVVALTGVAWLARSERLRSLSPEERMVLVCTSVVAVLIVTNKVFSSQYMLWLTVMVAAVFGWRPPDVRAMTALLAATSTTHVIFPYLYGPLVDGALGPLVLLSLRNALVLYVIWRVLAPPFRRRPRVAGEEADPTPREVSLESAD